MPAGPFRRFLSNFCTCYSRMDMFILQDLQSSKFWYIKISCSSNGSDVMTAWPSWNHLGNFWRSDGRTFFNFFLCVVSLVKGHTCPNSLLVTFAFSLHNLRKRLTPIGHTIVVLIIMINKIKVWWIWSKQKPSILCEAWPVISNIHLGWISFSS